MEAQIVKLPAHENDAGFRGETQRVAKMGGPRGTTPRYYLLSRVCMDTLTEEEQAFIKLCDVTMQFIVDEVEAEGCPEDNEDLIAAKAHLIAERSGQAAGVRYECLAFKLDAADSEEPTDYVEVAGRPYNNASIEEVMAEVLGNDKL